MKTFSAWDYVAFCSLFALSSIVGLFFAYKDRKRKSSDEYLLANRQLRGWPVGLSLSASFVSALTVMGTPAEVYVFGTMFTWVIPMHLVSVLITAFIFAPVFYKLGFSSVYEYLDLRFGPGVRKVGAIVFTIQMCVYMGIVTYMPALALNKVKYAVKLRIMMFPKFLQQSVADLTFHRKLHQSHFVMKPVMNVTGLSLMLSIVGTSAVCVFYTTIGGLKAVIWTDVLQCSIMLAGFICVIVQGSIQVGGITEVFSKAAEGGRIDLLRFDLDPRVRHSVFSILIGGTFMWVSVYGVNHSMVQRYLSCKSLKEVRIGLSVCVIGNGTIVLLAVMTGLTMYSVYQKCDPIASGKVDKSDQLVPYLVIDILHQYPGLPGLFVAVAYSGTLSTVSTGINALACTTLEDFIKSAKPELSNKHSIIISKVLVVIFGGIGLGLAFLASLFDKMLTMCLKSFGALGGPLLGVFCLGIFSSNGNSAGAYFGLIWGLVLGFWLMIGSTYYPPASEFTRALPTSTEDCLFHNETSLSLMPSVNASTVNAGHFLPDYIYSLSYFHVATVTVLSTWIFGYLASLVAGRIWRFTPAEDSLLYRFDWCSRSRARESYKAGNNTIDEKCEE